MIICIEMVPFSIFFHWAYDVGAYDLSKPRPLPLAYMGARDASPPDSDNETGYRPHQQTQPQTTNQHDEGYYGGPLGVVALITVLNPMEIVRAIVFGFSMRSESRRMNNVSKTGGGDAGWPAYDNYS